VAKESGVSATPVVLHGPYELWQPGTAFPNSGTIVMRILPPIQSSDRSVDALMQEVCFDPLHSAA
jgi:1-acyl-sn-glycerol-3-phosphate acyltransferase